MVQKTQLCCFVGSGHCSGPTDEALLLVLTLFRPDLSTIAFTSLLYENI